MESTVKERLISYLNFKKISRRFFEKQIGVGNGFVNNIVKGLGADKMQRILSEFPDLNPEWLLEGTGDMLRKDSSSELDAGDVNIPVKVFDRLTQLIDTVCSQQETIATQSRTIDRLVADKKGEVRVADSVKCAAAK